MQTAIKPQLRRLLEMAHQRQLAQIAALSDAARAEAGTPERWSVKDHLAHTTYWKERTAERLAAAAQGAAPLADSEDFQPINEANFEHARQRPWADILADDARIHAELLARLDALSEEELVDPTCFGWANGDALLTYVLGSVGHVQGHIAQYLSDRGDLEGATRVHEGFVQAMTGADLPAVAHAHGRYNLACFYAATGRTEQALDLLREALRLHPDLTDWSQQDPDFASLRDDPRYRALYTD
jgi:tetratricopeptide (TPR) repeat protein